MALNGIHIACVQIELAGRVGLSGGAGILSGRLLWSETLTQAGVTSNAAPGANPGGEKPCIEIAPSADSFVAIGANPDANAGPRMLIRAGENRNIVCASGDRVAWMPA